MNKYVKTLFPVFVGLLASCSSDDDVTSIPEPQNPVANSKKMSFSASIDAGDMTRAEFDGNNKTVWSSGDKIWIYNASVNTNNNKQYFTLTKGEGTKNANFEGEAIDFNEGENTNNFYAFYPYDAAKTVTFSGNTVSANIPSSQAAKENLFETGYQYMTAHTQGSAFTFRNLVSFFKVTVKSNSDFQISRIKIVANNVTNEDGLAKDVYDKKYLSIAGDFSAEISNGTGDDSGKPSNITITDNSNACNYVETTITPSNDAKTYYLAVVPTTDNLKFTLLLESNFDGNNGQKIYQATNSGIDFEAGKIYDLGTYDADNLSSKNKVLPNVVDLDLPSGTIWATTNVGASDPTQVGDYYKWGRTEAYTTGRYNDNNGDFTQYNSNDKPWELATEHDAAYQNYPSASSPLKGKFIMPNRVQARELTIGNYILVATVPYNISDNKHPDYYTVYSKNSDGTQGTRYILMPVGGRKTSTNNYDNEEKASYWSKTRNGTNAYWYDFREGNYSNNVSTIVGRTAPYGNVLDSYNYGRLIRPIVYNKNVAPASAYPSN